MNTLSINISSLVTFNASDNIIYGQNVYLSAEMPLFGMKKNVLKKRKLTGLIWNVLYLLRILAPNRS